MICLGNQRRPWDVQTCWNSRPLDRTLELEGPQLATCYTRHSRGILCPAKQCRFLDEKTKDEIGVMGPL